MKKSNPIERFWPKVDRKGDDECWPWLAGISPNGYGRFHVVDPQPQYAHRFAYELLVGPIPKGLTIDHLCKNKRCVNPAHMEPVTAAENTRRNDAPMHVLHRADRCQRGHDLSEVGYVRPDGKGRICRVCQKNRESAKRRAA